MWAAVAASFSLDTFGLQFELQEQGLIAINEIPTIAIVVFGAAITISEQEDKYVWDTEEITLGWAVEPILATEEFEPREYDHALGLSSVMASALALACLVLV